MTNRNIVLCLHMRTIQELNTERLPVQFSLDVINRLKTHITPMVSQVVLSLEALVLRVSRILLFFPNRHRSNPRVLNNSHAEFRVHPKISLLWILILQALFVYLLELISYTMPLDVSILTPVSMNYITGGA